MNSKQARVMGLAGLSLVGLTWGCDSALAELRNATDAQNRRGGRCTQTAEAAQQACGLGVGEHYWLATGNCENLPAVSDRQTCKQEASAARREANRECRMFFDARKEICAALGEAAYDPVIDPANFVAAVTNPYFPLTPGATQRYQSATENIAVVVTHQTKEILGVTCIAVRDTVTLRETGQVIEDTEDWYAQDKDGNVWYFGEISQSFEDGELVSIDGSWKAGVDSAKPGIIMQAVPRVGSVYRQEFYLGQAEDMAEVLSITDSASVPAASCDGTCLVTKDFLPLDPGHVENKYYAPGIGLILETDPDTGERVELISVESE